MIRTSIERADSTNNVFSKLKKQWDGQLEMLEEDNESYAVPYMDHAEKICSEKPPSDDYGIYVITAADGSYLGLFHANLAELPKTRGKTLRVLWALSSPRFDFGDAEESEITALVAGIFYGAYDLALRKLKANAVKIHLQSPGDRRLAMGMGAALMHQNSEIAVAMRGNWVHIEGVSNVEENP